MAEGLSGLGPHLGLNEPQKLNISPYITTTQYTCSNRVDERSEVTSVEQSIL